MRIRWIEGGSDGSRLRKVVSFTNDLLLGLVVQSSFTKEEIERVRREGIEIVEGYRLLRGGGRGRRRSNCQWRQQRGKAYRQARHTTNGRGERAAIWREKGGSIKPSRTFRVVNEKRSRRADEGVFGSLGGIKGRDEVCVYQYLGWNG